MSGLARKLGMTAGQRIGFIEPDPGSAKLLVEAMPEGAQLDQPAQRDGRYDLLFTWPRRRGGLEARFNAWSHLILADGAIWVVFPKKTHLADYGVEMSWAEMQAAALQTDLVDNKAASLSAELYATRFVIRKERRTAYE